MTKTPGDGKPFLTKAEQDAAYSDKQKADNEVVRREGLDGLKTIADRNQAEAED
jgi:hypothetical protein